MTLLALTRDISPAIVHCELTHLERVPIDLARARAEHEAYEDALRMLGCRVERLASDATMPDSVFIEDTAIVLPDLAVMTRPGAPRADSVCACELNGGLTLSRNRRAHRRSLGRGTPRGHRV